MLIGYLDRQHAAWQSDDARFTVHGRYDPRDLPDLLSHYRVSLVLYPSAGPETFSYTLSESWARARRRSAAIGVGREGPMGQAGCSTMRNGGDQRRMLDRIEALLAPACADDLARASRAAAAMPRISIESMAAATLGRHESALRDRRTGAHRPLARERVRDALGYRAWVPTAMPGAHPSARADAGSRIAQTALRLRQSSAGPLLRALTPGFVREALKVRLK